MNENKLINRIPFEEIESVDIWAFPSWDNASTVVPSVKKNQAESVSTETIEDVETHNVVPLTAEQLQKITEEAAEEARQQGYQEGFKQGMAQGEEAGHKQGEKTAYAEHKEELQEKIRIFAELSSALMDPIAMQDHALEDWIMDTAVQLAKHLINRELTEDPSALFHIVQRAVASLPAGAKNIRVFLHPDDVELAHEAFSDSGEQWSFRADPQLSRGGCRVVSDTSLVDYSVETRLEKMLDEANFRGEVDDMPDEIPSYAPQHDDDEGDEGDEGEGNVDETSSPLPNTDADDPPDTQSLSGDEKFENDDDLETR